PDDERNADEHRQRKIILDHRIQERAHRRPKPRIRRPECAVPHGRCDHAALMARTSPTLRMVSATFGPPTGLRGTGASVVKRVDQRCRRMAEQGSWPAPDATRRERPDRPRGDGRDVAREQQKRSPSEPPETPRPLPPADAFTPTRRLLQLSDGYRGGFDLDQVD